jgi:hypothetical protein
MADIALGVGLAAIFCAVVIVLATIGVLTGEREQVGRTLAAVQAFQAAPKSMRRELDRPFRDRVIAPLLDGSTGLGRRLTPAGQVERIRKRLDAAGQPANWDVDRVLAFKVLSALGAVVLVALTSPIALSFGVLPLIGFAVVAVIAGFYAPDMVLYQKAYNRADRMRKELPDALDQGVRVFLLVIDHGPARGRPVHRHGARRLAVIDHIGTPATDLIVPRLIQIGVRVAATAEQVIAVVPHQPIVPVPAPQRILAVSPVQSVGARIAGQHIVACLPK